MKYQNFKTAERLAAQSKKEFGKAFEEIYFLLTALDEAKEKNQDTTKIEDQLKKFGYKKESPRTAKKSTKTAIHITTHTKKHKMAGIGSISTSVLENPFCQQRRKCKDSICAQCYANNQVKIYPNLNRCLERNTELLTKAVLPYDELPTINDSIFRFEAFGDLGNEVQFINYLNICTKNPQTNFALWTKNFGIVERVFKYMDKPENLILVASSYNINKKEDLSHFEWIDKVFTVYTEEFADKNGIEINCGARKCAECLQCYTSNSITEINEIVRVSGSHKHRK